MSQREATRKEIAECFSLVRRELVKGGSYICITLKYHLEHPARWDCLDIIEARMAVNPRETLSLEGWLIRHKHATLDECTVERMHAYRLRWLDSLIEEFSHE